MKLFIFTVIIINLALFILLGLFLFALKKFNKNECKNRFMYFIPSLFAVFILVYSLSLVLPYSLDLVEIITKSSNVETVTIKSFPQALRFDSVSGSRYSFNAFEDKVVLGSTYQIRYTSNTKFAYDFIKIEEVLE